MYRGIIPAIKIRQKFSGFSRFGAIRILEKHPTFLSESNENKITALLKP